MYEVLIIIFVIIVLVILIGTYYYTAYTLIIKDTDQNKDEKSNLGITKNSSLKEITPERKNSKYGVTILSNNVENIIRSRVMNLITKNGTYFIYTNKGSELSKQLEKDPAVTICNYSYKNNFQVQYSIIGDLKLINTIESINVYQLNVRHKGFSKTTKIGNDEVTGITFDEKENRKNVTSVTSLKKVISFCEATAEDIIN
uniref:Uncharacterized protein n=1 Tax=viral metagenome TaxID=1070528 RepID=A0A6C0BDB5_9ZZZZ